MALTFNPFTGNLDFVGGTSVTTWKTPVANAAALPLAGNTDGDARVTLDTDRIWVWDDASSRWEDQQLQASATVGSTPNAVGYSIVENETVANLRTNELVLQPADSTNPGIISTAAQNIAGDKTFDNNVIITGDLTVNGTTTTINTTNLEVTDQNILINDNGNDATAEGAGLTVERTGTNGSLAYEDALASKWKAGALGSEVELANVSSAQTLTNKTIDADNNTISNLAHGAEVDNPSSGVHGVTGNIVGTTDSQTLTNKTIDADNNTISNIDDNEIKAAAGINATKLGNGDVDNTELSYLNGVTSSIQTQLDGKVDGPASATDDAIARYDGATGKLVQNSGVTIDDADVLSGASQINVDNLRLDGNTLSSTDVDGDVVLDPNGTGDIDASTSIIKNVVDPTANQHAATKKYVDDNTSFVPGDLDEVSFSLANNQASFTDVTGVAFTNGVNRSAELQYSIEIDATADLFESGKILAVQRGADWVISQSTNGDISQILFDITASGQLQYRSGNYAGFVSGTLKVRALTTSI